MVAVNQYIGNTHSLVSCVAERSLATVRVITATARLESFCSLQRSINCVVVGFMVTNELLNVHRFGFFPESAHNRVFHQEDATQKLVCSSFM